MTELQEQILSEVRLPEWIRLSPTRDGESFMGRIDGKITFIQNWDPSLGLEEGDLVRVDKVETNPKGSVFFAYIEFDEDANSFVVLKQLPPDRKYSELQNLWLQKRQPLVVAANEARAQQKLEEDQQRAAYEAELNEITALAEEADRELVARVGEKVAAWVRGVRTFDTHWRFSDDARVSQSGQEHEERLTRFFDSMTDEEKDLALAEVFEEQWPGGCLVVAQEHLPTGRAARGAVFEGLYEVLRPRPQVADEEGAES